MSKYKGELNQSESKMLYRESEREEGGQTYKEREGQRVENDKIKGELNESESKKHHTQRERERERERE